MLSLGMVKVLGELYCGVNAHAILKDTPDYLTFRGLQAPWPTTLSLLPMKSVISNNNILNSAANSTIEPINNKPSSESTNGLSNGSSNSLSTSSTDENRESSINTSLVNIESKITLI